MQPLSDLACAIDEPHETVSSLCKRIDVSDGIPAHFAAYYGSDEASSHPIVPEPELSLVTYITVLYNGSAPSCRLCVRLLNFDPMALMVTEVTIVILSFPTHNLFQPRVHNPVRLRVPHMRPVPHSPDLLRPPILRQQHRILNRHTAIQHTIDQQQSATL